MNYKIVKVRWLDSCSSDRWQYMDDIDMEPLNIVSIGYLIKDEKDYIVIAQNISNDPEQACNLICIPRVAIIKIIDQKEDERGITFNG